MGELIFPHLLSSLNIHMHFLLVSSGGMGSTILQRLITLVLYIENVKVINTHDLVNKYIDLDHNKNIIRNGKILYGQTLEEVQTVLENSNKSTSLISRLSKDHMDHRNETDPKKFYDFLTNFYTKLLSCERENVFELTLSLAIKAKSDIYNVFDDNDRKTVENVTNVDEGYFIHKLKGYIEYKQWIDENFPGIPKITYEELINDTDNVLHSITGYQDTLRNHFGIPMSEILRIQYQKDNLNKEQERALSRYTSLCERLIQDGILREVPIKNSSPQDKKHRITNFDRCLKIFYQFTKDIDCIDKSKATYDSWNRKEIVI